MRVLVPFFVAQVIRCLIGAKGRKKLKGWKKYIKKINEISLLYMVFCALSETFYVGIQAEILDIVTFLIIIICLHCHGYIAIWCLSALFRCLLTNKHKSSFMAFTVYDRVACIYSGVSKTIALGIPIIETIYADNPNIGFYILPILFYHPSNLIIGSLLVEPFKKLVEKEGKHMASFVSTFSETNLTHNTDYGALLPYQTSTPHKTELSSLFEPFTPLPDEPEDDSSMELGGTTTNQGDSTHGLYR